MTRLFSFGCSFTQYKWPTWADIMGKSFDHYENWGLMGAGNFFIAASVSEACATRQIKEDDTVVIMWTNVFREDRYIEWWKPVGNIHTQNFYNDDFIYRYITERGCYIRDLAVMYSTKKMLDSIGCKYTMLSMVDLSNPKQYENSHTTNSSDILEAYKEVIDVIKPSVHDVVFNYDWHSIPSATKWYVEKFRDPHPTPKEHLQYLDIVMPELEITSETREWVNSIETQIQHNKQITDDFKNNHLIMRDRL